MSHSLNKAQGMAILKISAYQLHPLPKISTFLSSSSLILLSPKFPWKSLESKSYGTSQDNHKWITIMNQRTEESWPRLHRHRSSFCPNNCTGTLGQRAAFSKKATRYTGTALSKGFQISLYFQSLFPVNSQKRCLSIDSNFKKRKKNFLLLLHWYYGKA